SRIRQSDLMNAVKRQPGLKAKHVRYLTLPEIRGMRMKIGDLSFLKRYPFEQEKEFRIIHELRHKKLAKLDVAIPLSCIHRITVSPWMDYSLFRHVKRTIRSIKGCNTLEVVRSTLIGNQQWKKHGERAQQY